ncbi:hypothetical protein AMECASPLE_027787 [Ameca splendens]|uniref:Uncharacterized protein n=1 Tax=Ameca splendens TaxID=208324 RepID=A0ABV1A1R5_9TELE
MIDDRMTLLDPVEELCLFASKETLARFSPPIPMITGGRDRLVGEGVFLFRQWHHGNSAVTVCLAVARKLLLLKVLAVTSNYHVPANIENLECKTCAVIGNGFVIKNSSLGNVINKYDIVIRLNDAPVRGYEEDVGNKTTMRFFYPESASYNPALQNEPDTLMVLVPFKQQDLCWLKEIIYNEKRVRKGFWKPPPQIWLGDVSKVRVLDPHFLHQTAHKLLRIPPQKGKQA